MQTLPAPLQPFAAWVRFVVWFATPDTDRPGKTKKLAVHWQTGAVVAPEDPAAWTTADVALAAAPGWNRGYGSGAGFVFCTDDPFFFLDIDNCLIDGQWSATAQDMCARFSGAAVEVSQSGRGLHIFGRYTSIDPHGTRCKALGLELYSRGRFVALTGLNAVGDAATDHSAALSAVIAQHFPPSSLTTTPQDWTDEPVAEWRGPDDDTELMRRALAATGKSAAARFGGAGVTLADLWNGDVSDDERSESDQALANHLAFWTGKNCDRIERLMRQSGLVREKWDSPHHANYLANTILKACAYVTNVYVERTSETVTVAAVEPGVTIQRTAAHEYLGAADQLTHFQNCHYVSNIDKVFNTRTGRFYSRSSFNVWYGGHIFMLDATNQRKTDSAWEAFTQNAVNQPSIVDALIFRPELEQGVVVHDGVRSYLNSYVPHVVPAEPGDPSVFLDHMQRLFPDQRDRLIILHYMASLVQNPGVKFQWWPVIQGGQGNGKTWIIRVLTYCLGEHYCHLPNAHALARDGLKFNAWINRKLFIGIEEVRLNHKREFLDEFKIVVTNDRLSTEAKGGEADTTDNRANGILCTNHPDGVPIDPDETRYAIFFTAQQTKSDKIRDGMTPEYFKRLYDWAKTGGFAAVAHFLQHMPLDPAMDPAQGDRAPMTTSRDAAIALSYGRIEQEILEAIDEGRPGFTGGWVSSHFLDALVERTRVYLPRNKRRAVMQSLGYDYHPGLKEGRVNNTVMPDNAKPRLYVPLDGPTRDIVGVADIERAYSAAQTGIASPPAVVLAFSK